MANQANVIQSDDDCLNNTIVLSECSLLTLHPFPPANAHSFYVSSLHNVSEV